MGIEHIDYFIAAVGDFITKRVEVTRPSQFGEIRATMQVNIRGCVKDASVLCHKPWVAVDREATISFSPDIYLS